MKNLYSYITEAMKTSKQRIRYSKELKAAYAFVPNGNINLCNNKLRDTDHPFEYIRGYFGDADNETLVINSVRTMIDCIIKDSNYDISIDDIDFEYGFYGKIVSGKYNAVKMTSKVGAIDIKKYALHLPAKGSLYAVNTCVGTSKIKSKTFTPDSLNLVNSVYTDETTLMNAVKAGLARKGLSEYEDILIDLCKSICNDKSVISINDMLNKSFSYLIDISNRPDFKSLSVSDLNCIAKDFGEVLGPIFFLNKLKRDGILEISFPKESNYATFDYFLNDIVKSNTNATHKISAKANQGSSSSIVDTVHKIKEFIANPNNKAFININDANENIFLTKIIPVLAESTADSKNNSTIRANTWKLVLNLEAVYNDTDINEGLKVLREYLTEDLSVLSNKDVLLKHMTSFISSPERIKKLKQFLTTYYESINYPYSTANSPEALTNEEGLIRLNASPNLLEGIILYPLKSAITRCLNKNFKKYITYYMNLIADGYQLNLALNRKGDTIKMEFNLILRNNAKYTVTPGGDVSNPLNKSIGIKIV